MSPRAATEAIRVGRRIVEITHPEKVLFPHDGITKRDFVGYYHRIAPAMLPHLRERPIAMERYPDGIYGQRIFQKNTPSYYPDWVKTVSLAKKDGLVRHVVCNDAATLVYLANQAVITPHTWLSRVDKPNHPDQMIFDLDPSDGDFQAVCDIAKRLRELLTDKGLISFVKSTGSRGFHVLVPLNRRADFDQVRAFARQMAEDLAQSDPEHLTIEVRKNKKTRPHLYRYGTQRLRPNCCAGLLCARAGWCSGCCSPRLEGTGYPRSETGPVQHPKHF